MNFSIRTIILDLLAPDHRIGCSTHLWKEAWLELKRRGIGRRESGAFLLGLRKGNKRRSLKVHLL